MAASWQGLARALSGPAHPRFEAEELLARATGRPRSFFLSRMRLPAAGSEAEAFESLVARRAAGEPLQYLLGEWEFRGRTFHVDARALIPRGETELIVDAAREAAPAAGTILDLGTGSGILAVTLALERPGAHIVALDLSLGALALTRRNVSHHRVEGRVFSIASDWLSAVRATHRFELAVANPPLFRSPTRRTSTRLCPTGSRPSPSMAGTTGSHPCESSSRRFRRTSQPALPSSSRSATGRQTPSARSSRPRGDGGSVASASMPRGSRGRPRPISRRPERRSVRRRPNPA